MPKKEKKNNNGNYEHVELPLGQSVGMTTVENGVSPTDYK
jgi:hypothetical protein